MQTRTTGLLLAATMLALLAPAASSQETGTISDIRIEGNEHWSDRIIASLIRARAGQEYNEQVIKQDQKRLLDSGRFESVVVSRKVGTDGVVVTITVKEHPPIRSIRFIGNRQMQANELRKELPFGVGDPLSKTTARTGQQAILSVYRNAGYHAAEVVADPEALKDNKLHFVIDEGQRAFVRELKIKGNDYFSSFWLRLKMGQTVRFWPFVTGAYNPEQVQRDLVTIRNMYIEEGFLDVEVGRLPPEFSDSRRRVTLTIVIREGPRFRVNKRLFKGNTVFSDDELRGRLQLERGDHITGERLAADEAAVRDTYGEVGFINARVQTRRIYLDPQGDPPAWAQGLDEGKPALVNLEYTITEQDQYNVGKIEIHGNRVTQARVIRRELSFYPEQLYDTVAVQKSKRRLEEMFIFNEVKILPTGNEPRVRDVLVEVTEGYTGRFAIGAAVNSNSGLVGQISVTERNFDILSWPSSWSDVAEGTAFRGGGQMFKISAEPGAELSRFSVEWREPALFDKPYALGVEAYLYTRERSNYDESRYGAMVSLGHRFPNRWYGEVAARAEQVKIDSLSSSAPPEAFADEGSHFMPAVKGSLIRDRTDSRWLPSRGDRLMFSYEQIMGDYNYGVIDTDYRRYHTLYVDAFDRKHIIAGRVNAAYIVGDAPIFDRFYGGGIGSVRGFQYRGISPRSTGTDEPIGGDFLFYAGTEYSFPLVGEQLRGLVFLDSGTVERDFELTTYRIAAGFGLRWTIPFFGPVPMSLDFAFPLASDENDDEQIFNFAVGWTF
ncbi:MAG: outer membrane protein assembly factor BamA [Planctomycetota bacterium]